MKQLLLIDDNPLDRKIIRDLLTHHGYSVAEASDGASGMRMFYAGKPDLVLLDVLMPRLDGWTVCERLRELCDVPIIMLTSLDREEEMVRGLDLGADDFVSKPISSRQLLARVAAVLRRAPAKSAAGISEGLPDFVYDDGVLRIEERRHQVSVAGERVELTPTEFRLLVALAKAPDRVREYPELLRLVWGPEYRDDIDFLRVYVWRLRKKLESDSTGGWISTERGFGYRFVRQDAKQ